MMADVSSDRFDQRGRRFNPPSAVVGPAFAELLRRLRIYALSQDPRRSLTDADREILTVGYQARKKVFHNTLGLIFGQWALYRVAIRNLPRTARGMYGIGAFFATGHYISSRAYIATGEMFARIINLPDDVRAPLL